MLLDTHSISERLNYGYSNSTGTVRLSERDVAPKVVYGPYLKEIPPQPVGQKKGSTSVYVTTDANVTPQKGGSNFGWFYNQATQTILANLPCSDVDDDGVAYNTY